MNIIVLLLILVLLFGGGGFAFQGARGGLSGVGLVLIVLLILWATGKI